MVTVSDCLSTLRRRIGDTDTPFTYTDAILLGYISDAVDSVELEYQRGVSVLITTDPITSTTTGQFVTTVDLTPLDAQVYAIKAHYLMTLGTKSQADRNNFRMVKGRLTLDNTNQAKDHKDTLDEISKEFTRALVRLKNGGSSIKGVRIE
jgi:hypothetical protein